jgi:hypothetical protein
MRLEEAQQAAAHEIVVVDEEDGKALRHALSEHCLAKEGTARRTDVKYGIVTIEILTTRA